MLGDIYRWLFQWGHFERPLILHISSTLSVKLVITNCVHDMTVHIMPNCVNIMCT